MNIQKIDRSLLLILTFIFFFGSCAGGKNDIKVEVKKKKISNKENHKRKKVHSSKNKKKRKDKKKRKSSHQVYWWKDNKQRQRFNKIIYWRGNSEEKKVALTFDDGPYPVWTQKVLDVLKEYKVKATFFLIGRNAERYPWVVKRIVEEGHIVGNHTYTHNSVSSYSLAQAKREIEKTEKIIKKITGKKPYLLRPPYGGYQNHFYQVAQDYNYKIIFWSVTVADWRKNFPSNEIAYQVITHTQPGAIVLLHDGGGKREATVRALPRIIKALKKEGYKFVTVEEMFSFNKKENKREERANGAYHKF